MATTLTYVYSREFRGWACSKCDWRFPANLTDASAQNVVTLFDGHRCGDRSHSEGEYPQPSQGRPMSKTSALAEWVLPLGLWIVMMAIFASLVIAALSTASG